MAKSEIELEAEYKAILPLLSGYCDELNRQLGNIIKEKALLLGFPIQSRIKSWASISEKISRTDLSISKIRNLQDLVGIRIILLFKPDVEAICRLLERNLLVVKKYDTSDRLEADRFGYTSIHFVVKFPEPWLAVPTMAPFKDILAEIQVRSVAQHIWAEASNKFQYKQESNVPEKLLRGVYRISALLETIDLEFERILGEREQYRSEALSAEENGLLNVDLLEKILDKYFPPINKENGEQLSFLLEELKDVGIDNLKRLTQILDRHSEAVINDDRNLVESIKASKSQGEKVYARNRKRIEAGVYYTHGGLMRCALSLELGKVWKDYQKKKYENIGKVKREILKNKDD